MSLDPEDVSKIRAESSAVPVAPYVDTGHVLLSKFVYDLARRIEARNMSAAVEPESTQSDFLEELIAMIGRAPLSQEYAMKLVFAPPASIHGTGPHKLVHEATGQWAWCGGPGLCRWCTEGSS